MAFKKQNLTVILATTVFTISLSACGDRGFKQPSSNEEWRALCQSEDYRERLMSIKSSAQRELVAGTCMRAPWQEFEPSEAQTW